MNYEHLFIGDFSDDDKNKIYIKEPLDANMIKFEKDGFTIKLERGVEIIHVTDGIVIRVADHEFDHLIRHKWPEDKPKKEKEYLVRSIYAVPEYEIVNYYDETWAGLSDNHVTHWWELPEVTEE